MQKIAFVKPGNFFLLRFEKHHFWANVMFRQSFVRPSRASPAQKLQGLRVVCSKKFSRATFFVFWVTELVNIYLSYLPVKQIWWKSAVCTRDTSLQDFSIMTLYESYRFYGFQFGGWKLESFFGLIYAWAAYCRSGIPIFWKIF